MKKLSTIFMFGALLFCALFASNVSAQFASTDFLIADFAGDRIARYDQNLVFLGYLDTGFNDVSGLTLLSANSIAAGGRSPGRIKIYAAAGGPPLADFLDPNIDFVSDLKSFGGSRLFVGTQVAATAVTQFTTSGTFLGSIGSDIYAALAVLPGNVLWASVGGTTIDRFDFITGLPLAPISVNNNGQAFVDSMFFSFTTSTVLISDSLANSVFERDLNGVFIREFTGGGALLGVTRGPGGNVYATDFTTVYQWTATGTFVSATNISANVMQARNIVWAGNADPSAASVSISGRVTDANGRGISRATVSVNGSKGAVGTTITNPFGYYRINGIEAGNSYVFEARHKRYSFTPQALSVDADLTDLNFTAN